MIVTILVRNFIGSTDNTPLILMIYYQSCAARAALFLNCFRIRTGSRVIYTHRQYPLGYSVGSRASYWNEFVRRRSFFNEQELERSVCESVQGLTSIFLSTGIMSKLQRIHERSESCKLSPNEKSGGCVGSTPKACLAIVLNEIPIQVLVRHVVTVAQLLNFFSKGGLEPQTY